jgi:hypothetical protein
MELVPLPRAMRNRGFTGWPEVYRVSQNESAPPPGISYVIAEEVDFALLFRLMIPTLEKQHGYFSWPDIYKSLVGEVYYDQRVYHQKPLLQGEGHSYGAGSSAPETMTIEQLAMDKATYVDIDMLAELAMIPAFLTDIREAITVNVTNGFMWQDGFNKKTGICSGSLIERPKPRSLIILDISSSIPDGVSAGMLTLIKTITDIVCADLIITGSTSYFYTKNEAMKLDIREVRRKIGRSNESTMFTRILETHDMNYENVITFGDSDNPGMVRLNQRLDVKRWYSFFCMTQDTYGYGHEHHCGYGRWIKYNCPTVEIIDNCDWAKFFKPSDPKW